MELKWHIEYERSTTEALGGLVFLEVKRCSYDLGKFKAEVRGFAHIPLGPCIKGKNIAMLEACAIAEERFFELLEKKKFKGHPNWERFIKKSAKA